MRSWDPAWERVFRTHSWGRYPGLDLVRFAARNLYALDRASTKVLEIGSGPGANLWFLAREGFDVAGIDGSATAVRLAKKRLADEGLTTDLRVGDVLHLPWTDASFRAVVDVECLFANDFAASEAILREVHRVLTPGGLLFSQTLATAMAPRKAIPGRRRLEFSKVLDGPHAGKGFMRLSDRRSIRQLYGKLFSILSVDKADHTSDNGKQCVSEWVIVCRKDRLKGGAP